MSGAAVAPTRQSFARDLLSLTKPRIISLLRVTTIAPMYVAGRPDWRLVLAVFVGGYLMAGGANAVNMYLDRDIDDRMSRTRLRPIPSGRMRREVVIAFGVLCATTATFLLAHVANVLTAALALNKQVDYGRAGVPMAPLVWGERETMRNMLWYTLILLPLTFLPVAFGALGIPYLVAAVLLGGWLLIGVIRVLRASDFVKPAWSVYKYSLLYLALLFAAMVVDRAVA